MNRNDKTEIGKVFPETQWSLVLRASEGDPGERSDALNQLCAIYWLPLYSFARRNGKSIPEAEDLTQSFLSRFIRRNDFEKTDPSRGKLRSYLLKSFKRFMINDWKAQDTQKRRVAKAAVSLDRRKAESHYDTLATDDLAPDRLYDRSWALALIDSVLLSVRDQYAESGKEKLFDALKFAISGKDKVISYGEVAQQLGMREGAVKTAVHRLRTVYREALRDAVASTLSFEEGDNGESEVDTELRELLAALGY